MGIRYTDSNSDNNEFTSRNHSPNLVQFAILLGFGVLLSIIIPLTIHNPVLLAIILATLFSFTGWYVILQLQRNRDLVLATEFQNALFTSALGSDNRFCLIVKKSGDIYYMDQAFNKLFSNFVKLPYRHLDAFVKYAEIAQKDAKKILGALDSGVKNNVVISITTSANEKQKIFMTIEPINRPKGFILLRGRDYIEERHSTEEPTITVSNTTLVKLLFSTIRKGDEVFLASPNGKLLFVSPTLEDNLGYERGEILARGASIQDMIYVGSSKPDSLELEDYHGEIILQKKTEDLLKYQISQELIRSADGNVIGCSAVLYDEDRPFAAPKTPSAPVISNNTDGISLASFVEQSPIAMVQIDSKGNVTHGNQAFHDITHNTITELPFPFINLIANESNEAARNILDNALSGNIPSEVQVLNFALPNNPDNMIASIYFSSMHDDDNALVLYLIDITEQKNLEERFSHSQKMQAVGQLAGGVAHDFNNLLTAMIGFCDLLLMRHPAGDQSFSDIMQIKQNANRAANLVRQLLAFSRRQTLQPKVVDITDVLAELSNLIRRLIGENIELKMIHGRELGNVRADQGQLEQVLINLAVNARDAMPDGGTLSIQTSNVTINMQNPIPTDLIAPAEEDKVIPAGQYVLVEVKDTGCGISREILEKVFEPFFSTKPVGSGTGLGLSTVYGIIKQSGGYIYVESSESNGTSFSLYFPLVKEEVEAESDAENPEKTTHVDLTGKSTVLLVEDETPVRLFAARALRNKGYTVLEADCAETAIEVMDEQGQEVEIIVTDVIMPGMNGPTMIKQIADRFPDIKVIFISGYAEDVFVNNYGSERSFNFLAKPFTLKQLASKIKEVVG